MSGRWIKLDLNIANSSLMKEGTPTIWAWIVCLTMAGEQDWKGGTFQATPFTLAARAMIEVEDAEHALTRLTSPDNESTTPDFDGRRLIGVGKNQYQIVNWEKYQGRQSAIKKRFQRAEGQEGTSGDIKGQAGTRGDGRGTKTSVSSSSSVSSSTKTKKKTKAAKPAYTPAFEEWWERTWRRGHKAAAFATWELMEPEEQVAAEEVIDSWSKAFSQRDAQRRPHVSTWLNNRGWDDVVDAEYGTGKGAVDKAIESKYSKFD